jgi:hypothetical protein
VVAIPTVATHKFPKLSSRTPLPFCAGYHIFEGWFNWKVSIPTVNGRDPTIVTEVPALP